MQRMRTERMPKFLLERRKRTPNIRNRRYIGGEEFRGFMRLERKPELIKGEKLVRIRPPRKLLGRIRALLRVRYDDKIHVFRIPAWVGSTKYYAVIDSGSPQKTQWFMIKNNSLYDALARLYD